MPFLFGDVNYDCDVNSNDYAMLRSYVYCQLEMPENANECFDYCADGAVDGFDALFLDLYISTVL